MLDEGFTRMEFVARLKRRSLCLPNWVKLCPLLITSSTMVAQPASAVDSPAVEMSAAEGNVISNPVDALQAAIDKGLEYEQARMWGEAIRHYEKATRDFPNDVTLYQRMVISRLRYDVGRRFKDESYLQAVREMSVNSALDLYLEILANLQTHYVDEIDWARVLTHGTAALEVALSEQSFVDRVLPNTNAVAINQFRNTIHQQLQGRSTATRFDLRAAVTTVAQRGQSEIGLSGTVVALEYLSGAVSTLDPYTRLLSPRQLNEMFSNIEGNFVGLGLELKAMSDHLQILSVIPGGPAEKAGIVGGERIIGVAGTSTSTNEPEFVADLLRGPESSFVGIDIEGIDQTVRSIEVQRQRVEVPCVENIHFTDVENRVGYFRLTNFQKTTTRDVERALWQLHRQGMRSLVIDVRGNPGGLLSAAVEVADRFIGQGAIVTTRGRNVRENYDYRAHRANTWNVPLAVLIDGDSASASEIFAGAISDSGRGHIVGETSYGKGSVQGIFRMQTAQFGLCLTTAKFYSPSGRAISLNGVEPTVPVTPTYIAARPNAAGRITTDQEDAVLQRAIEKVGGGALISQLP